MEAHFEALDVFMVSSNYFRYIQVGFKLLFKCGPPLIQICAHHTNYDAWTADAYKLQPPKIAKNSPILHKNCAEGLVGMTWAQDQVDSFTISFQWTKFEGKLHF